MVKWGYGDDYDTCDWVYEQTRRSTMIIPRFHWWILVKLIAVKNYYGMRLL